MRDRLLKLCSVPLLIVSVGVAVSPMSAQTSLGQISGVITDPTGAAIPMATVTITNTNTQAKRSVETDSSGTFIATNLPIGSYSLAVTQPGFRTEQQGSVVITADAKVTSNFTLQLGSSSEVVTVEGGAVESINTTSGELARVIDSKQVENLALNGRNCTQLLTLVPGADKS